MSAPNGITETAAQGIFTDAPLPLPVQLIHGEELLERLTQLLPQAKQDGGSGATLATNNNLTLMLSVRTSNGIAEVHAHFDDLMIVREGSATLITGGTVVDPTTSGKGETRGTRIEGGQTREVKAGDVFIIPAGVPHQLLVPAGTTYCAVVAKVQE